MARVTPVLRRARTVLEIATGRAGAPVRGDGVRLLAVAARVPSEHEEQAAVVAWAEAHRVAWPALGMLAAVPNGGHRHAAVAGKQKAEGVRAGYPDLLLDVPRRAWHGLRIEMKQIDGVPSDVAPAQRAWLAALAEHGYRCAVAYGREAAKAALLGYLAGAPVSADVHGGRLVWWTPDGPA